MHAIRLSYSSNFNGPLKYLVHCTLKYLESSKRFLDCQLNAGKGTLAIAVLNGMGTIYVSLTQLPP